MMPQHGHSDLLLGCLEGQGVGGVLVRGDEGGGAGREDDGHPRRRPTDDLRLLLRLGSALHAGQASCLQRRLCLPSQTLS